MDFHWMRFRQDRLQYYSIVFFRPEKNQNCFVYDLVLMEKEQWNSWVSLSTTVPNQEAFTRQSLNLHDTHDLQQQQQ